MVVPVKEHQFFLVCDNEEGVEEFGGFAEHKEHTPDSGATNSDGVVGVHAEKVHKAVLVKLHLIPNEKDNSHLNKHTLKACPGDCIHRNPQA